MTQLPGWEEVLERRLRQRDCAHESPPGRTAFESTRTETVMVKTCMRCGRERRVALPDHGWYGLPGVLRTIR